MKRSPVSVFSAAVLSLAVFLPASGFAAPSFTITFLEPTASGFVRPTAINPAGQITGFATATVSVRSYVWTGPSPTMLQAVSASGEISTGFNAAGQVSGYAFASTNLALRWNSGVAQPLDSLGGGSRGLDINASGQIAGYSAIASGALHAVRWTGTSAQDLGTLGGSESQGFGINASGQVAGLSNITGNGAEHAVRWTGTTPQDLGTLGGTNSRGVDINASGQVAGKSQVAGNGAEHAVIWTGTSITDLGTLGGLNSEAVAINAAGDVIGRAQTTGSSIYSHFFYSAGTMYDLQSLFSSPVPITDFEANAINDLGVIAGVAYIDSKPYPLLLTPVPEPTTAGLIALGAMAALTYRRRSAKQI